MTNFDIYNAGGAKVADNKPSPVTVGGLTPNTTYTGWKIAYAGSEAKVDIPEFKTEPRKLVSFQIDKTEINGKVGETTTVTTSNFLPADTTDQTLNVFTEDGGVATVTYDHGTTYVVKLLNPGTTKLHFNANDNGGAHAETTVTVTAPAPEPKPSSLKTSTGVDSVTVEAE
ncbi:hypothetical protein [Weissella confusa]|uniref:hypothetical protein n=1 Tax=Weissella confusa TaxID=1583 RepID=UPI0018F23772|nr:hypothetical protein [Weissella confusa]MBJ7650134.1 hypothetical protein [Weissella confusa]MBJ7661921.1 hypothetical protein [Weissella confusa]